MLKPQATLIKSASYGSATRTLYQLSTPLQDHYPNVWTVCVREPLNGEPATIHPGRSTLDVGEWIACYAPLTAREMEFVKADISQRLA